MDKASFLADPASNVNLIKLSALRQELILNPKKSIPIMGITNHSVIKISTINLLFLNTLVEFHAMENSIPISPDGILGRPYLRQEHPTPSTQQGLNLPSLYNCPAQLQQFLSDRESQERTLLTKTSNDVKVEAATVSAQKTHQVGIKKLRMKTDAKFLVNSVTEWLLKREANYWKTNENKMFKNRSEFEKMRAAIKLLDVTWENDASHKGLIGHEMTDKLTREGVEALPSTEDKGEEVSPEQIIIDVLPQPIDSENNDKTDKDVSEKSRLGATYEKIYRSNSQKQVNQ